MAILVAVGAAISPASAAQPPTLRESSVASGWTNVDSAVAARYSSTLDDEVSDAELLDVNGDEVPGSVRIHINTITFVPEAQLLSEHGPYRITFTAFSVFQKEGDPTTQDTVRFQVDVFDPYPPQLTVPDATIAVPDVDDRSPGYHYLARIAVSDPTQPFELRGKVREAGEARIFDWSGIARLEAKFFDRNGDEHDELRKTLALECAEGCPFEPTFSIAADRLPAGYWTARVGAYDFAGNRSADSESVSFLVVR